jgi:hypothetical protein
VGLDLLTVEVSRSYSRHTTLGRTPLPDNSQQIYISSAGFEPAIPATKAPRTCALYRAATVIGEADALGQDKRNFGTTVDRVGSVVVAFHAQIYHCHKHA